MLPVFSNKRSSDHLNPFNSSNIPSKKQKSRDIKNLSQAIFCSKQKENVPFSEDSLSRIYGFDFLHPEKNQRIDHFFAIRDSVSLIESWMSKNSSFQFTSLIREKIKSILSSKLSYSSQMAELGLIYFYLDRDSKLPLQIDSLVRYRAEEMFHEIDILKKKHDIFSGSLKQDIPSGATHYILSQLACMVISSEQTFNSGGIYALKALLENPLFKISPYLKDKHLDHILHVAYQLIEKPQFKSLLEQNITIHSDLEDLIRLDFKLPKDAKVPSFRVIQDCLMALFFDIRQETLSNCFSVASLIYAIDNALYKVLSRLIELLQRGHFEYENTHIPIFPVLENRLYDEKILEKKIDEASALSLTIFQTVLTSLGLHNKSPQRKEKEIGEILLQLLKQNSAIKDLSYAKKLFFSFKQNTLVHLMLSVNEFQNINLKSLKSELIDRLIVMIYDSVEFENDESETVFFEELEKKMKKTLWFIDHYSFAKLKNKILLTGPYENRQKISASSRNLRKLKNVFKDVSYLTYIDKSNYFCINSISVLQKVLELMFEEVFQELDEEKKISSDLCDKLGSFFCSDLFSKKIAEFNAELIEEKKITKELLQSLDLFIFQQPGGFANLILTSLGIIFKKTDIKSQSPRQFMEELSNFYSQLDETILKTSKSILCEGDDHCFLLLPKKHPELWSNADFKNHLNKMFYEPAKFFEQKLIPKEIVENVLTQCCFKNILIESDELYAFFQNQKKLTYSQFREHLEQIIIPSNRAKLHPILDEEFMKVSLTEIDISAIAQDLQLNLSKESIHGIKVQLDEKINEPSFPFYQAKKLSRLLNSKAAVRLCVSDVEKAICRHYQLPIPLEMIDLIWSDKDKESPRSCHLFLRYHFGLKDLVFVYRIKSDEIIEQNEDFQSLRLSYPINLSINS